MRCCRVSKKRSRSNFHSLTLNLLFSVDIFTKAIKKKEEEKIKLSSRSSTIIQPFFNIHVTLYPPSIELPLPLIRDYFSKIFTPSPKERRCNSRVKKNWSTTRLRFETYTRDYLFSIPSRRTFFNFLCHGSFITAYFHSQHVVNTMVDPRILTRGSFISNTSGRNLCNF